MTKSSPARLHRRTIRKLAKAEAVKIGPAEARRKLAEWAARGGDIETIKGEIARTGAPLKPSETAALMAMGASRGPRDGRL